MGRWRGWSPIACIISTPIGLEIRTLRTALAGMLSVFAEFEREILRERVKAGFAQARAKGIIFGRPKSAAQKTADIKRLYRKGKLSNQRSTDDWA